MIYYKIKEEKKAEIIGELTKLFKRPEIHNYKNWLLKIEEKKNGINTSPGNYIEIPGFFTHSGNFCSLEFSKEWFDEIVEELDQEEEV